jgi:integrase
MNRNPNAPSKVANFYKSRCGWEAKDAEKAWKARGIRADEKRGGGRHSLSEEETRRFLTGTRQLTGSVGTALQFALYTGLRLSELVAARWDRLQRRDWYGTSRLCLHVLGKGQKWRWVPLDRRAERVLEACRRGEWLFPGMNGHIAAATVQAGCKRIRDAYPLLSRLTPHVLRHTYTTKRVSECVEPEELMAALGHDSINTTLVYVGSLGWKRK